MEGKALNYSNIVSTLALIVAIIAIYIPEKNRYDDLAKEKKIEQSNIKFNDSIKNITLNTLAKYKKIINTKNINIFSDKYKQLNSLLKKIKYIDENVIELITIHKNNLVSWQTKMNSSGKISKDDFSNEVSQLHEKCQENYVEFCKKYSVEIDPEFFKKAIFY